MLLKQKLKNRTKKDKRARKEVENREKDKTDKIQEAQEIIQELQTRKDELEENGIKTKELKYERENEFQIKMAEMDKERAQQLSDMRQDYLDRIRKSKDPQEKEKLIEEMGRRMAQIED